MEEGITMAKWQEACMGFTKCQTIMMLLMTIDVIILDHVLWIVIWQLDHDVTFLVLYWKLQVVKPFVQDKLFTVQCAAIIICISHLQLSEKSCCMCHAPFNNIQLWIHAVYSLPLMYLDILLACSNGARILYLPHCIAFLPAMALVALSSFSMSRRQENLLTLSSFTPCSICNFVQFIIFITVSAPAAFKVLNVT